MASFVKINGIWREFNPETNEIIGESGYVDISNLEKVEVETMHDLDWNNTVILNKALRTGWLSPDGKFYGCEPWCHRIQAEIVHKKSERQLEEDGWVRITYNISNENKVLTAGFSASDETIYPTSAQLTYLLKNYQDNKHLYFTIWKIASDRKEKIKDEWGVGD